MQPGRLHRGDHVKHEPRQMPLLQSSAHRDRQQEQLIARRAQIHPRRSRQPAFRRLTRHHPHHLLTQAPAAAISRKNPAQEVLLAPRPDRKPVPPTGTFPPPPAATPNIATASSGPELRSVPNHQINDFAGLRGGRCKQTGRALAAPLRVPVLAGARTFRSPVTCHLHFAT